MYTDSDPKTGADLWYVAEPTKATVTPRPMKFLATEFDESQAQLSPDQHWVAYVSNESGQEEVNVRPFPAPSGSKWKISVNRGVQPRWRSDGKELFYMEGAALYRWMTVNVRADQRLAFEAGQPQPLFSFRCLAFPAPSNAFVYSVARDGQRFLVNSAVSEGDPTLNVVVNWQKATAPAAKEP